MTRLNLPHGCRRPCRSQAISDSLVMLRPEGNRSVRHFILELERLQEKLLEMGGFVEGSIHASIATLIEREERHAEKVWQHEARINQCEIEIDDLATQLLALQQPMARDLRF